MVVLGILERERLLLIGVGCMLLLIGAACYLFITAGILNELYADPVKAFASEEEKKRTRSATDLVSGIIMSLATAVFLFFGFAFGAWHPAWVAFPVGGVLCGCASSLLELCGVGKSENGEEESEK